MKRDGKLLDILLSDENIDRAMQEVNDAHRYYPGHIPNRTIARVEANPKFYKALLRDMLAGNFIPSQFKDKVIFDKSAGKERTVSEPPIWPDQYVHHALVQVIQPRILKSLDPCACASIKTRGIHFGLKRIKKWMKNVTPATRYCLEMDIYHFYDSIKPDVVLSAALKYFKDGHIISLMSKITENGVKIGAYTSQWFANMILTPLDHAIREGGFGISEYIRYMDNFTIFASSKRKLKKIFRFVSKWLAERGLAIKSNWQIFPASDRLPTALGYRYGNGYTLLRKRNLLRLKRSFSHYYRKLRKGRSVSFRKAAGALSRFGQLQHCNHTNIFKSFLKKKTIKALKNIVRRKQIGDCQRRPHDKRGAIYLHGIR